MMHKRIIVIVLTLTIILMFQSQVFGNAPLDLHDTCKYTAFKDDVQIEKMVDEQLNTGLYNLNEALIITKENTSKEEYSLNSFSDVNAVEVRNISEGLTNESFTRKIIYLRFADESAENLRNVLLKLNKRNDIEFAEPNYINTICDINTLTPDDPSIGNQWGINKIGLQDAWSITTGSYSVMVGVIDSGININHPDLQNQINSALSTSFSTEFPNATTDYSGHGTKVAGIIGAQGNNGIGISGVCWNVSLVSLKVGVTYYDAESGTYKIGYPTDQTVSAINYAQTNNIKILNYSASGTQAISNSLKAALQAYTGLFICSAGNENLNLENNSCHPAGFKAQNVITVAASTSSDNKWNNSNYGAVKVDIFAPGQSIYTCLNYSSESPSQYGYGTGTSYAAPFVAGVAALLLSNDNSLTASALKIRIMYSSTKLTSLGGLCLSGGRLNALAALQFNSNSYTSHTHTIVYCQPETYIHTNVCACGFTTNVFHSYTNTYNSTHHVGTCICGYINSVPHNFTYSIYSDIIHKKNCYCGYTAYESHTWIYIDKNSFNDSDNDDQSRISYTKYCSKCGLYM